MKNSEFIEIQDANGNGIMGNGLSGNGISGNGLSGNGSCELEQIGFDEILEQLNSDIN